MKKTSILLFLFFFTRSAFSWIVTEEGRFQNPCDPKITDSAIREYNNCPIVKSKQSEDDTITIKIIYWKLGTFWSEPGGADTRINRLVDEIHNHVMSSNIHPDLFIFMGLNQEKYGLLFAKLCHKMLGTTPNSDYLPVDKCTGLINVAKVRNRNIHNYRFSAKSFMAISREAILSNSNKLSVMPLVNQSCQAINKDVFANAYLFKYKIGGKYWVYLSITDVFDDFENSKLRLQSNHHVVWGNCLRYYKEDLDRVRKSNPVTVILNDPFTGIKKIAAQFLKLRSSKNGNLRADFYPNNNQLASEYASQYGFNKNQPKKTLLLASYPKQHKGYPQKIKQKILHFTSFKPMVNHALENEGGKFYDYSPFNPSLITLTYRTKDLEPLKPGEE